MSNLNSNTSGSNIIAFARGDVNGDRMQDNIYLTGTRTPNSPFFQNITLVIQNGRNGRLINIPLKENAGYNPTLFLGDFTGNGVEDILIGISTGGSGGIMYYYIYSFNNNMPILIFNFNLYNDTYKYTVTYKDNYTVEIISEQNNNKYFLDITNKGEEYLNEIYDNAGKLKEPIAGFVNPLSGLYPVDFDSNKTYELLAFQKIAGRHNADTLGYIQNILKWKNNMFILDNQYVAIEGV